MHQLYMCRSGYRWISCHKERSSSEECLTICYGLDGFATPKSTCKNSQGGRALEETGLAELLWVGLVCWLDKKYPPGKLRCSPNC